MGGNLLSIVQTFIFNVIFGAFNGVNVYLLSELFIFFIWHFHSSIQGSSGIETVWEMYEKYVHYIYIDINTYLSSIRCVGLHL